MVKKRVGENQTNCRGGHFAPHVHETRNNIPPYEREKQPNKLNLLETLTDDDRPGGMGKKSEAKKG